MEIILTKAAASFIIVDEFGKRLPSSCDGPIATIPGWIGHAWVGECYGVVTLSMSGDGRSARLESDAGGVQMSELGTSAQV
jgi:hypothetical protein